MDPKPAKKQVYVHIGFPKTGTTSIQVWMAGNTDILAAQGVLYSVAGRGEGNYRFGHHLFPSALAQTPLSVLATSWPDMDELHNEIRSSPATRVVISSENFCQILDQAALDLFAGKLADFDVKIICYMRPQDEFVISLWSTAVAYYGEKQPLTSYLAYPGLDYAGVISFWARAFGSSAIRLRVFERSQLAGANIVADALITCGIDASVGVTMNCWNRSPPAHISMIMSYLNAHDVSSSTVDRLREMAPLFEGGGRRLQLLASSERVALLARYAESNSWVARTYLGRADGRLFSDTTISDEADTHEEQSSLPRALAMFIDGVSFALASTAKAELQAGNAAAKEEGLLPDVAESVVDQSGELPDIFREMPDEAWLDVQLQAMTHQEVQGFRFPRYPEPAVQAQFVGSSWEAAMREAFKFYTLTKGYSLALGAPIGMETNFLDFGVGWGRFLRFFWKDVPAANLYGCDVDPDILEVCKVTGVPGNLDRLYTGGRLPYPDNSLGCGIAYSVFTHLSEQAHLHWMRELARVLRPGAVFCLTLEPRRFIDFIEQIPDDTLSVWHHEMRRFAGQANELRKDFDRGRFVYLATGGGAYRQPTEYGEAIVPASFVETEWAEKFAMRAYIDEPSQFWQAVAVLQRI